MNEQAVNMTVSEASLSSSDLLKALDYFMLDSERSYYLIQASSVQTEQEKDARLADLQLWQCVREMVLNSEVEACLEQLLFKEKNMEMETSNCGVLGKISSLCEDDDTNRRRKFYTAFNDVWNSTQQMKRLEIRQYEESKIENFLCEEKGLTIDQSRGRLSIRAYSDLEIVQDILFFDPQLQRVSKILRWLSTQCLQSEGIDLDSNDHSQKLKFAYQLLRKGESLLAKDFLEQRNLSIFQSMVESVFPYHDFLLSDSRGAERLQQMVVQNEISQTFLAGLFINSSYTEALQRRIEQYKQTRFDQNQLFNESIGNPNWIQAVHNAIMASNESKSSGERNFFGFLASDLRGLGGSNTNTVSNWYEELWATLQYTYFHELIKRVLVIKTLLKEQIEQFYPSQSEGLLSTPTESYLSLFRFTQADQTIGQQLTQMIINAPIKLHTQGYLLSAYLKDNVQAEIDAEGQVQKWEKFFAVLEQNSNQFPEVREVNARLGFCLLRSQLIPSRTPLINKNYDEIVKLYVVDLFPKDKLETIIAFLKNVKDTQMIIRLLVQYMSSRSTSQQRNRAKECMVIYGYDQTIINMVLSQMVQSSTLTNDHDFLRGISRDVEMGIIDGLKMLIQERSSHFTEQIQHFLIAARKFLKEERLSFYSKMRDDREVQTALSNYQKYSKQFMGKESDPFLNELQAYDDIRKCYDILEKIEGGNQKLYLEFILQCEITFFKFNSDTGRYYILIDDSLKFENSEQREFNSRNQTRVFYKELIANQLRKAIMKCLEFAAISDVSNETVNLLTKYLSPCYDAFKLFTKQEQAKLVQQSLSYLTTLCQIKFTQTLLTF